jgi:hypothetical protein
MRLHSLDGGGTWMRTPEAGADLPGWLRVGSPFVSGPFEASTRGPAGTGSRRLPRAGGGRLRLPDPPAGPDSRGGCRSASSSSLWHFQELAQRCEQDASASASDWDAHSQASTAVPLESVDTFVHSASELAVEALKLGRTNEAQKIIRLADNLYDTHTCGSSHANALASSTRLRAARPGALRSSSRTGATAVLRELAELASDDIFQASSRPVSQTGLHANHFSPTLSHLAPSALASSAQLSARLYGREKKPSGLGEGSVVNVYGNAYFGPQMPASLGGQEHGHGQVEAKRRSARHCDALVAQNLATCYEYPLHTQARMMLTTEDARNTGLGLQQPGPSYAEDRVQDKDHCQSVLQKPTQAAAPLLPCKLQEMSWQQADASGPCAFDCAKTQRLQAAGRAPSMQSLEDTCGLRTLIRLAADRRDARRVGSARSAQQSGCVTRAAEEDNAISRRASGCKEACEGKEACDGKQPASSGSCTREPQGTSLNQSGAANPGKEENNPRTGLSDSSELDVGTLPSSLPSSPLSEQVRARSSPEEAGERGSLCSWLPGIGGDGPLNSTFLSDDADSTSDSSEALEEEGDDESDTNFPSPGSCDAEHGGEAHEGCRSSHPVSSRARERTASAMNTLSARRQGGCGVLQRAQRCHLARRRLQEARESVRALLLTQRHSAALIIQSCFLKVQMKAVHRARAAAAASNPGQDVEAKGEAAAARVLQGFARLVVARKAVRLARRCKALESFLAGLNQIFSNMDASKPMQSESAAAGHQPGATDVRAAPCVTIQCAVRVWGARRQVLPALSRLRGHRAAEVLQHLYRAHAAKRRVIRAKQVCARERGVGTLQTAWRAHRARCKMATARQLQHCTPHATAAVWADCYAPAEARFARVQHQGSGVQEAAQHSAAAASSTFTWDEGGSVPPAGARVAAARHLQRVVRGHHGRQRAQAASDTLRREELEFCQDLIASRQRVANELLLLDRAPAAGQRVEARKAGFGMQNFGDQSLKGLETSAQLRRDIFQNAEDVLEKARRSLATPCLLSLDDSVSGNPPAHGDLAAPLWRKGASPVLGALVPSASDLSLSLSPILVGAGGSLAVCRALRGAHIVSNDLLGVDHAGAAPGTPATRRHVAATTIQSMCRGHRARDLVRNRLRVLAALRLQRVMRGHQGRLAAAGMAHARPVMPKATPLQVLRQKAARKSNTPSAEAAAAGSHATHRSARLAGSGSPSSSSSWASALMPNLESSHGLEPNASLGMRWESHVPVLGCESLVGSPTKGQPRRVYLRASHNVRSSV